MTNSRYTVLKRQHDAWIAQVNALPSEARAIYLSLCAAHARYVLTGNLRQPEVGRPFPRTGGEFQARLLQGLEDAGVMLAVYVPHCLICGRPYPASPTHTDAHCEACTYRSHAA